MFKAIVSGVGLSLLFAGNAYAACTAVSVPSTDAVMRLKTDAGVGAGGAFTQDGGIYYDVAMSQLRACVDDTWRGIAAGALPFAIASASQSNGAGYGIASQTFDYNNGYATTKVNQYGLNVAKTASAAETFVSGYHGLSLFAMYQPVVKVNSTGLVGIGPIAPNSALHVADRILAGGSTATPTSGWANGTGRVYMTPSGYLWSTVAVSNTGDANVYLGRTNATRPYVYFGYGAYVIGAISTNGSSVAYETTSDARLKENVSASDVGIDALMRIKVRDFNFIADADKAVVQGYIAQELNDVYPDAVKVGGDDVKEQAWSVDYGRLSPLLVKAVQQLKMQHDSLLQEEAELLARLERAEQLVKDRF